jgi:ferric-dicitrate binding protein FerR (iron transport regulator)
MILNQPTMEQGKLDEIFRMAALSALYVQKRIGDAEKTELEAWIERSGANRRLFEALIDPDKREKTLQELRRYDVTGAWQRIRPKIVVGRVRDRRWMSAAAVIALVVGGILLVYYKRPAREHHTLGVATKSSGSRSVVPGGTKATLILANGSAVRLNDRRDSTFRQGASVVSQQPQGLISYTSVPNKGYEAQYNTLITPKGGEYSLVLADGTRVWLNAASSLRYPTAFTTGKRVVELTGEAFFEVTAQPGQPFIVRVGNCSVEVLGTHFNINAYDERKSIRTTLTEGSVSVTEGDQHILLKPGEQAKTDEAEGTFQRTEVNIDQVMAWKNGLFYFDDTNIQDIMQEIARWYNVNVEYKTKNLANKKFSGIMSRYSDVNALLKRMELTKTVHFEVTGRTIIVMD